MPVNDCYIDWLRGGRDGEWYGGGSTHAMLRGSSDQPVIVWPGLRVGSEEGELENSQNWELVEEKLMRWHSEGICYLLYQ